MTAVPAALPPARDAVRVGQLRFAARRPLDGAMGSELLLRGVARGEPLALQDRPSEIRAIHRAYVRSGAQWLTTHTFLLHAAPDAPALVHVAVALAREAAGRHAAGPLPVALSLGPGAAPAHYAESARAAAGAGAALVLLETFPSAADAVAATRAAASSGLPIVALMVFDARGRALKSGDTAGTAAQALADAGAAAVGANCQEPDVLRRAVEEMAARSLTVPVVARPSAGIPVRDGEAWVYPRAPEPWAAATRALQAAGGAALVGGCCGAGPAHIAALARLLAARHGM